MLSCLVFSCRVLSVCLFVHLFICFVHFLCCCHFCLVWGNKRPCARYFLHNTCWIIFYLVVYTEGPHIHPRCVCRRSKTRRKSGGRIICRINIKIREDLIFHFVRKGERAYVYGLSCCLGCVSCCGHFCLRLFSK